MLCLILGLSVLSGCGNSLRTFEMDVERGNYERAIQLYEHDIAGNSVSENAALGFLQEFMDESWLSYASGSLDGQDFLNRLDTLERIDAELHLLGGLEGLRGRFEAVEASKESYARGVEFAEDGNFAEAIAAFSAVVPDDTENYESAQAALAGYTEEYQSGVIANAERLAAEGRFDEAIISLTEAERVLGKTSELEDCLFELHTQSAEEKVGEAYESGDWASVIREYVSARDNGYVVLSTELTNMYSSAVTEFLNEVRSEAEAEFGPDRDYAAAIEVLRGAIGEVSVDSSVTAQLESDIAEYQEYIPISLLSLNYTQIGEYMRVGSAFSCSEDVNGTEYGLDSIIYPTGGSLNSQRPGSEDEAYVQYNLNLKYSVFSGLIYRPYSSLKCDFEWAEPATVKVYGDGVLIYESPAVTQQTYDTIEFSVDVTGVRTLRIVMTGVWGMETPGWVGLYEYYPKACLTNATLQK